MNKNDKIDKAKRNILRGNDIESAALILEAMILDNYIEIGGRVSVLKVATRQIINFIEENKNKGNLDYIREKVQANVRVKQLENEVKELEQALEELQQKEKSRIIGNINEIKIEDLEPILKPYYIPKEKVKLILEREIKQLEDNPQYGWVGSEWSEMEVVERLQDIQKELLED